MLFMNGNFNDKTEKLLRAVWPKEKRPKLWTKDGKISPAAFDDIKGLSVDRTGDRTLSEAIDAMRDRNMSGDAVSVTVGQCVRVDAFLKYDPTDNIYHTEIHGSKTSVVLNDMQKFELARNCIVEGKLN